MNPLLRWLTSPEWAHTVTALLHSLWQGALVALTLALLMRRLTNPLTRYRCALGALGVIVIAGLVTWGILNAPATTPTAISPAANDLATSPAAPEGFSLNSGSKAVVVAPMTRPTAQTNWTTWLALLWMTGAMAMLLRAGIKVAGAEKLRRSCQPLADENIAALVAEACRAVKLARKIRVAVTDKLTSPAVVGVIVPTLILPLSLFTTLTPTQIQFVLLHELAHIRRGDYLANLFQLFAEALLFFNPAVWWISHQIRREREACCDALAIELSGAPADYARTLVRIAENILQPAPNAALAFGDDGRELSSLADRVQRVLIPDYRPSLRLTWRTMLAALFVGSGLLFLSALGTRVTVAAILSPRERMDRIENRMIEYGEDLHPDSSADNPNAPEIEISGRITTADGTPLPQIKWVSIYYSRKSMSGASSARLGTNGIFRTHVKASGRVAAVLNETGFAPVIAGPVTLGGTNAVTNLNLVLDRGFDVPVFVTDAETGSPVVGTLVKAQFGVPNMGFGFGAGRELQTDAAGVTTMAQCSGSVELTLVVSAPGYEIADLRAARLSASEPIRIPLKRGHPASGIVLDKTTSAPLAGATIRIIYEQGQRQTHYQWTDLARRLATTDALGRFTATQLRRGTKYWLGIGAPGHESALIGPVMAGAPDLTVRLGPELIIRGRVLGDLDGLQVINQDYCLSRHYSEVFENHSQGYQEWLPVRIVDGIAMIQFTNPIPGLVRLSDGQGFEEEREVTGPVDDWVIDLRKTKQAAAEQLATREVVFRFIHPEGAPPRGTVAVTVPESLNLKNRTARSEKISITNSEVRVAIAVGGRTAIEPERMVGYWFDRVGPNGSLLAIEVTNGPGPMVIELPLISAGAIYAKARNADGSPAGGLHFGVREIKRAPSRSDSSSLGSNSDSVFGNEPRTWVSGPLPLGGTYQVYGWRGNAFCVSKPIALTEEKPDAEVELQFAAGKTITGLVLNPDGQPCGNLELEANFSLQEAHGFGLKPVVTDDRGEFKLETATPELGTYSVTISAPGLRAEHVKLDFNGRTQTIRLQPGLTLLGRVVEADTGYPIPNAEVRAWDSDTYKYPQQRCRTDAAGRFEFTTLAAANYSFHVGDGSLTRNITARPGASTNLTLEVKLYEWSKLKPQKLASTTTNQPNHSGTVNDPNRSQATPHKAEDLHFPLPSAETIPASPDWLGSWTTNGVTPSSATATNNSREPLFTREFELSPKALYSKIITNLTPAAMSGPATGVKGEDAQTASAGFRVWFRRLGIDLDPQSGRSVFYSNRGGLLVRATKDELDTIEAALQKLGEVPPRVHLKVRWLEIPSSLVGELLLPVSTNMSPSILPTLLANGMAVLRTSVLSRKATEQILPRLVRDEITLLNEVQITTLSGRQAQIQLLLTNTIAATGINPQALTPPGITGDAMVFEQQSIPLGPVFDVLPQVNSNHTEVSLLICASGTTFLGYEKTSATTNVYINGQKQTMAMPSAKFSTYATTNSSTLQDGQTLVLGNLTTTEITTKPDRTEEMKDVTATQTNNLYVLITATLIDSAGNPINKDLGIPSKLPLR